MVQHGIDEFGLFAFGKERLCHIDKFVDHHLWRRSGVAQFGTGGAEQGAQGRVDAGNRPFCHQRTVGCLINGTLPVHRIVDDGAKQHHIAFGHFVAFVGGPEAVGFKFCPDGFNGLTRGFHLEQRLQRVKPRGRFHLSFVRGTGHSLLAMKPMPLVARDHLRDKATR